MPCPRVFQGTHNPGSGPQNTKHPFLPPLSPPQWYMSCAYPRVKVPWPEPAGVGLCSLLQKAFPEHPSPRCGSGRTTPIELMRQAPGGGTTCAGSHSSQADLLGPTPQSLRVPLKLSGNRPLTPWVVRREAHFLGLIQPHL